MISAAAYLPYACLRWNAGGADYELGRKPGRKRAGGRKGEKKGADRTGSKVVGRG